MPTRSSGRKGRASDPTTEWAEAAVRGDFVVGDLVRYSAERHLRDLRDLKDYHWRPELAQRALDFFPSVFTITDGPKAGQPFDLLPYHVFCVGSLMGWVTAEARWRFRSAYIETGKGQAKSPMMGGLGIYAMGWCGFPRAPVYAIGGDKNTANVLFKDAAAMCRAQIPGYDDGETLETEGHVVLRGEGDNVHKIEHPSSQSFFLPLASGDNQSGPRPRLVLADEIHEFRTDSQLVTWRRAITKVAGSAMLLMGSNTPATSQIVGTQYSELYQAIARGKKRDDTAFAFVARVDEKDRETVLENEACWIKALPALGITYPVANIREEVVTAKTKPSEASSIKRLYFGIPTGAVDFWIAEDQWAAVQKVITPDDLQRLKNCRCWLSLDLSKKNDLTALTATWLDDDGKLNEQDASGAWTVDNALYGTDLIPAAVGAGWVTVTATIGAYGTTGCDWTLSSGTVLFRPSFRLNPGGALTVSLGAIKQLLIEDITESMAAAAQASAAASSASVATTKATEAGQSASAAQSSAVTASTKAGEASTSASNAATSATGAAGSASTASAQATLSANYSSYAASRASGNIVAKGTFEDQVKGQWSDTATLAYDPGAASYTYVLRQTNRDCYESPATPGNMIDYPAGAAQRIFRLTGYAKAPGSFPALFGLHVQNASGVNNWYIQQVAAAGTTGYAAFSTTIAVPAGNTKIRPVCISDGPFNVAGHDARFVGLVIEDITESMAAAAQASAAASSASVATTKATEAAVSASSASSSSNTAATKATEASNSAAASASSASSAATSSTNAGSSATAAQNSAIAAQSSASNANTSATAASGSATTADQKAAAAASSASLAASYRTDAQNAAGSSAGSANSSAGSAVAASGSAAAAQTSATLSAQFSTGGGNLVPQSDFVVDTWGYGTYAPYPINMVFSRDGAGDDWRPTSEHNLSIYQGDGDTGKWGQWHSEQVSVEANKWYEFSAYLASHRCNVELKIVWHDAAGNAFADAYSGQLDAKDGGRDINNWQRWWVKAQAPSNASRATLVFIKWATFSGQGDSWAWMVRPMFREVPSSFTSPAVYAPSANKASLSQVSAVAADAYGRTRAFWQVNAAVPGQRAQLSVYADNAGAGVDIQGDLRVSGNALFDGTVNGFKLADLAVGTTKVNSAAIDYTKLAQSAKGNMMVRQPAGPGGPYFSPTVGGADTVIDSWSINFPYSVWLMFNFGLGYETIAGSFTSTTDAEAEMMIRTSGGGALWNAPASKLQWSNSSPGSKSSSGAVSLGAGTYDFSLVARRFSNDGRFFTGWNFIGLLWGAS